VRVPTNDRPIFVVGCPRSGTTMLQLMLHAHPRIAIPPETRFLLLAYEKRRDFGDLRDAANRLRLASWITGKGTNFADLGLDPREVAAEIVAGPPTLGSALGIVFRAYARRFGKPRWGDKRPAYLNNIGTIRRLFPDAQIVHIIRDGRDCVASLKEAPWHKGGVRQAIAGWNQGMDAGRAAARHLPADTYFEIRYEALVADPKPELVKLCEFLGEDFDPGMTEPSEVAAVAVPTRKKWHALTHDRVTTERVGRWAERLSPAEIALCETLMGSRLVQHGYPLQGTRRVGLRERSSYLRLGLRGALSRGKHTVVDTYYQLRPPVALAARLTSAQRANP
jgi:Sulfotransferase family